MCIFVLNLQMKLMRKRVKTKQQNTEKPRCVSVNWGSRWAFPLGTDVTSHGHLTQGLGLPRVLPTRFLFCPDVSAACPRSPFRKHVFLFCVFLRVSLVLRQRASDIGRKPWLTAALGGRGAPWLSSVLPTISSPASWIMISKIKRRDLLTTSKLNIFPLFSPSCDFSPWLCIFAALNSNSI